jgi:hypothetical protein
MLVVETIARIRREHFIKGKTIKEIARDLKVSRNTVRSGWCSAHIPTIVDRAVRLCGGEGEPNLPSCREAGLRPLRTR